MQTLEVDHALAPISDIGYDGAELCLMPGWPSQPLRLDAAARHRIRESAFAIPSVIEAFNPMAPDADLQTVPLRIHAAAELAHDIAPEHPPCCRPSSAARPAIGEKDRDLMATRLAVWAKTAGESGIQLAVKAHAGSARNTPDKLIWLLDRVNNPALIAIYDYGHFQLANLAIEQLWTNSCRVRHSSP